MSEIVFQITEDEINMDLGIQGPPGPPGEKGDLPLVAQDDEPEGTDVIWIDTDEEFDGSGGAGGSGTWADVDTSNIANTYFIYTWDSGTSTYLPAARNEAVPLTDQPRLFRGPVDPNTEPGGNWDLHALNDEWKEIT